MQVKQKRIFVISFVVVLFFCMPVSMFVYRWNSYRNIETVSYPVSEDYEDMILSPLPYKINPPELNVGAESAILINYSNGNILYEKNADEIIPPASMTKLFCMYVVEEEIAKGKFSYNQIVPLMPKSWACNMPPHSSLMFLGKGQVVTMEELLLGLSICSGNDAAYALAYTVCGSMELFVERMNQVADSLGLKNTHFVESSGYSELNTTTAREMAEFARVYIKRHPQSIERFHSKKSFTYPQKKNLAPGDVLEAQDFSNGIPEHITMPVTQMNTNPLLGKYEGCDGLKTGYIDESGYNLALTVCRDGNRFISVTMRGKGNNTREGQAGRIADGMELMDWAFYNFCDADISDYIKCFSIKNFGTKEKTLKLIPEKAPKTLTFPKTDELNSRDEIKNVLSVEYEFSDAVYGAVEAGTELGSIKILIGKHILQEIKLQSEKTTVRETPVWLPFDRFIYKLQKKAS